jgi:hypothetical protein
MGQIDTKGYGELMMRGKEVRAHRAAWSFENGPIPPGMHVLHRCDNPKCVRPDHLFLGTNADNMADKTRKGRTPSGANHWNGKKTHCKFGHPYDVVNSFRAASGKRVCRACRSRKDKAKRQRKRASVGGGSAAGLPVCQLPGRIP